MGDQEFKDRLAAELEAAGVEFVRDAEIHLTGQGTPQMVAKTVAAFSRMAEQIKRNVEVKGRMELRGAIESSRKVRKLPEDAGGGEEAYVVTKIILGVGCSGGTIAR